jgi:hypothetical protein
MAAPSNSEFQVSTVLTFLSRFDIHVILYIYPLFSSLYTDRTRSLPCFGGMHYFHFQCQKVNSAGKQQTLCLLVRLTFRPWRWRQYIPPTLGWSRIKLHGVMFQKIVLLIVTAVLQISRNKETLFKTTSRLRHHELVLQLSLESYCVPFSTYARNQNRHIGDHVEHNRDFLP